MFNFKTKMIVLFFFSGISGLIYEIIWTRMLTGILGSSIYAITIILSIFMAGLAVGSFLFGKIIDKNKKIPGLKFYAFLEIGIALSASISFFLLPVIKEIYILFFNLTGYNPVLLNSIRFFSSIIILIIPTILMGGTLPVLLKSVVKNEADSSKDTGLFYGINTLGGVAGIAFSGFWMIESFGVRETFFIAVLINLLIGSVLFLFNKALSANSIERVKQIKKEKNREVIPARKMVQQNKYFFYIIIVSYGLSGLVSLALETLWTRSLIFFIGSSTYAFSIILLNFLFGITAGSLLITLFIKKIRNHILVFSYLEIILALTSILSIILFNRYSSEVMFNPNISDPIFLGSLNSGFYYLFLKTLYIVFPSTLIMGMLFPLVNHIYNRSFNEFGANIGKVYSANTFGTIFGSLLAAFILIPLFGVSKSIAFLSILNIIIAVLIFYFSGSTGIKRILFYSIPAALILFIIFIPYIKEFKSDTERPEDKTIFYEEDISATVKVYRDNDGYQSMSVNGMMIGGTQLKAMRKQILLAHLPMLFHPNPQKVLTIGLGTGITLSELANYKPQRLDCIEIVDAVKQGAYYFSDFNNNIIAADNTGIYIEDGRNFLLTNREKYDVIIDDSMLRRESAGNGPLYSDEYYQDCSNHLTKNGIFCQWLPLYLEKDTYQMVLRTLKKSFPHISLFYLGHSAVIQIATKEYMKIDINRLKEKLSLPVIKERLELVEMSDVESIIKSMLIDDKNLNKIITTGEINSDNNPFVEFRVPKEKGLEKTFSDNLLELAPYRPSEIPSVFDFSGNPDVLELKNKINKTWNSFHYILSGSIFTHSGEIKKGQLNYLRALEIDPNDKNAIYFLNLSTHENKLLRTKSLLEIGNLFLEQKKIAQAIYYLSKSIETDSSFTNGYNALANLYFDIGKISDAIILGEKSIRIIPNNSILLFNLATYYEEAKNYKRAFSLYEESLKIDPTNKYAREGMEACRKSL